MNNKINYGIGGAIVILAATYFGLDTHLSHSKNATPHIEQYQDTQVQLDASSKHRQGEKIIAQAYQNKLSNIQVESIGKVIALLPDDNKGSRHQKFILELSNGQTILVAHNIDLAEKINTLQKGDMVKFYGEYEYSNKGGVIHWTHHDPRQRHPDGWLKHNGKIYK